MSGWDALYDAMRTLRTRRIGPREADHLLAGDRAGPTARDHAGLAGLLAAAAAPARPDELAGELAAVAAFARAHRESVRGVEHHPRRRGARILPIPRLGRMAAVKVAAGLALFAAGGTAIAAETGHLPDAVQRQAHDLFSSWGVPAPQPDAGQGSASPAGGRHGPPAPTRTGGSPAPETSASAVAALCRAWTASQQDPRTRTMTDDDLRALAAAAGGRGKIRAYCAGVLGGTGPGGSGSAPDGAPQDQQPGNGNGAGNGGGNGPGGNGNGNGHGNGKGHVSPTPNPHR